jgi:hypothetical protein
MQGVPNAASAQDQLVGAFSRFALNPSLSGELYWRTMVFWLAVSAACVVTSRQVEYVENLKGEGNRDGVVALHHQKPVMTDVGGRLVTA